MKHLRRSLCLLLAGSLALTLAACGKKKNENEADAPIVKGRYVEIDITPPAEGRFSSFLASDGSIVCYDEGLRTRYVSLDGGGAWSETPGPGSGTDRYQSVQAGTPLSDGGLLVYITGEGFIRITPDGSEEPYPVSDIDDAISNGDNVAVSLLQALGGDRLLLSYSAGGMVMQSAPSGEAPPADGTPADGTLEGDAPEDNTPSTSAGPSTVTNVQGGGPRSSSGGSFSSMGTKTQLIELSTGSVTADLSADFTTAAASDGSLLYLMNMSGIISSYNLSDGKPSGRKDITIGSGQGAMIGGLFSRGSAGGGSMTLGGDGSLYAAHDGSIIKADSAGVISTVLESTAYSIGAPRNSVSSLLILDGGYIIVNLLENGQNNRLYKYVWDDNAIVDPNKTLSVWSLEDNSFVRAAIAELRKKHPDAAITYEVATDGESAVSMADAIKTLNTRLLGGSGPDIILLDGCPIDSYTGKGMLLDLSGLIDTGGMYDNLLAPYIADAGLYCLPTQFIIPALMGSAEALEKARTLNELVDLVVTGNTLPSGGQTPGNPFAGIPEEERAELYFSDLRELCKLLWVSGAPVIVSDNKLNTGALREYLEAAKAISDKYGLADTSRSGPQIGMAVSVFDGGTAAAVPGSLVRYTSQMTNYGAFTADNLQLLQMMMQRSGSALAPFPGLASGAWEPSAVVGISADTKVQEFAAEFVQIMLSTNVQQLNYGTGLPVTRSGMAAQIDAINDRLLENDMEPFSIDIDALIAPLSVPSASDTVLTNMMWTTVEKCCKSELDIEGAVKEIEQNVKNYLAERS